VDVAGGFYNPFNIGQPPSVTVFSPTGRPSVSPPPPDPPPSQSWGLDDARHPEECRLYATVPLRPIIESLRIFAVTVVPAEKIRTPNIGNPSPSSDPLISSERSRKCSYQDKCGHRANDDGALEKNFCTHILIGPIAGMRFLIDTFLLEPAHS